ncbi:MAG: prepilin peptidase [Myxococcaceae bacterium]|nr:prepilin peptidase [Myxococcaceae bacterium]
MSFVESLFTVWVTFLGLCVGSFLNVVIGRLPLGESIVYPGSRCPQCKNPIAWYDNIPVVSWLVLRGQCRHCQTPISPRYILVEMLVGVLYLLAFQKFGWTLALPGPLIFIGFLVALSFIDAEHWVLPFEITLPGIVVGLLLSWVGGLHGFYESLFGALLGFLGLRAVEYFGWLGFRKEAMGAGDKFLFALIGAFLGWRALLGVMLLASIQGSVFGIGKILVLRRKNEPEKPKEPPEEKPPAYTMTWEFLQPGLSIGRRLLLLPYSLFLQPIPDAPLDEQGEEVEWKPDLTNIPFGPWLALGALEVLLWAEVLAAKLPLAGMEFLFGT